MTERRPQEISEATAVADGSSASQSRGLCMKPELMLFDEPTSALDSEMILEVFDTPQHER